MTKLELARLILKGRVNWPLIHGWEITGKIGVEEGSLWKEANEYTRHCRANTKCLLSRVAILACTALGMLILEVLVPGSPVWVDAWQVVIALVGFSLVAMVLVRGARKIPDTTFLDAFAHDTKLLNDLSKWAINIESDKAFRSLEREATAFLCQLGAEIARHQKRDEGEGLLIEKPDTLFLKSQFRDTYNIFAKFGLVTGPFDPFFPPRASA